MAFKKGDRANPGGRPKDKAFADSLRIVVNRTDDRDPEKRKKIMLLAEKLVDCALSGEGWAMQQVADRLDGKPAQEAIVTLNDRAPDEMSDAELIDAIREAARRELQEAAQGKGKPH